MKKARRILAAALIMIMAFCAPASAGSWMQNEKGWWYQNDDGTFQKSQWFKDTDGLWYYFNEEGYMLRDQWVGNYYVGPTGAMLVNTTTPDGKKVGADGALIGVSATATAASTVTPTATETKTTETVKTAQTKSYSYIGNCNSGIFHRSTCPSVKRMNDENKVELESRQDAVDRGYKSCKNCNP